MRRMGTEPWTEGCIQSEARMGINRRHRHNGYGTIKEVSACNLEKMERNKGWNPQVPGLLIRWPARHVVVCSSHDGHMTEYGTIIFCDVRNS